MINFYATFPDLPSKEGLIVKVSGHSTTCIPDGKYFFLEHYCTNLQCDCKSCVLEACQLFDNGTLSTEIMSTIDLVWTRSSYVTELREDGEQSKHADNFLKIFNNSIKTNDRLATIKQHYRLARKKTAAEKESSVGRNGLCPCGSGNKYKRCCLNKQTLPKKHANLETQENVICQQ